MKYKERLEKFLELQNKNLNFIEISKELKISESTLRSFLNKRGYKSVNGKYEFVKNSVNAENKGNIKQIEFVEVEPKGEKNIKIKRKSIKKDNKDAGKDKANIESSNKSAFKKNETKKSEVKKKTVSSSKAKNIKPEKNNIEKKANTKNKPKKDRKINITQVDLDKLCEVYDWYLEVKDNKSIKSKVNKSNKKDINIEEKNLNDLKSTSIRVDKKVWEDFERLCSNSSYTKQEIITQALKDFMKDYKNLL